MNNIPSRSWLGILLLLDAVGLGYVSLVLFRASSGSGRALLFGLSAPSLLLLGLTLLAALGFLAIGLLTLRGKLPSERWMRALLRYPTWSIGLLAVITLVGWLTAWTPAEYFKDNYYYALRLIPLAGWLAFASGSFALFLLAAQRGMDVEGGRNHLRQNRAIFLAGAVTLAVIVLTAWLASHRIVGMNPEEEDFWYGAGVPVLAWQVLTAILIGWGAAWGEKKFLHNGKQDSARFDALVFVLVWAAAGFLWAQTPITFNFLITQPYPPNFAPYPSADGSNYDLASQYALIGQGLFNGGQMRVYFERPLYSAFLFYLHLLAGQDFTRLLSLQAFLYGVFPGLAYLIGKNLRSRAAGAALAALLTLRGWNGLVLGGVLETSTQKMLLTEFPAAIGLALILLLAVRWAQTPRNWLLAAWLGGAVGLWSFARPHILFFLPPALLLPFALYWRPKRLGAALAGVVLLAYLAAVLPWMQFNGSGMSLVRMYAWRAEAIIRERFNWPAPDDSSLSRPLASLNAPLPEAAPPGKSLPQFALDHFLNNLALSALALPNTLRNLSPETLVRQSETYWWSYWDGALSPSARILLPINLILAALGVGLAWRRAGLVGLFPLFGMLLYFLVNSLVRTSGGRYLVPADWVVMLYYLFGLAAVFEFAAAWLGYRANAAPTRSETSPAPPWRGLAALAAVAALGGLIPLTNLFYQPRYERLDTFQIAAKLDDRSLTKMGIGAQELQNFLKQNKAIALEGRALYPRYIWRGINPLIPGHLLSRKPYSRMTFTAIGRNGHFAVVLVTGDEWFEFPHGTDALVVGCLEEGFVDAWAVILPEIEAVYLRQPETPLGCPLPEPICDNNGWCRYE